MISLIMCSRKKDNPQSDLPAFMASLLKRTQNPNGVELLIKFDEDDCEFPTVPVISPIVIKATTSARRRGYADLHLGYRDLRPLVNPRSSIVMAVADDFICAVDGWDTILERASEGRDYFVLEGHNSPGLALNAPDVAEIDIAPAWSKKLLDSCDWDFFTYATDGWTHYLQHYLMADHGLKISIPVPRSFHRNTNPAIDGPSGPRWNKERREMLDAFQNTSGFSQLKLQASVVAAQIGIFITV